jgi:hypothetical protein
MNNQIPDTNTEGGDPSDCEQQVVGQIFRSKRQALIYAVDVATRDEKDFIAMYRDQAEKGSDKIKAVAKLAIEDAETRIKQMQALLSA